MADLKVLAELAAKIAAREENGAASTPASQAVFFPCMGKITVNPCIATYFADACPIHQTVLMAGTRTHLTGCQAFNRLLCPILQLPGTIQQQVSRLKFLRREEEI
jgi:hypothetical protein